MVSEQTFSHQTLYPRRFIKCGSQADRPADRHTAEHRSQHRGGRWSRCAAAGHTMWDNGGPAPIDVRSRTQNTGESVTSDLPVIPTAPGALPPPTTVGIQSRQHTGVWRASTWGATAAPCATPRIAASLVFPFPTRQRALHGPADTLRPVPYGRPRARVPLARHTAVVRPTVRSMYAGRERR